MYVATFLPDDLSPLTARRQPFFKVGEHHVDAAFSVRALQRSRAAYQETPRSTHLRGRTFSGAIRSNDVTGGKFLVNWVARGHPRTVHFPRTIVQYSPTMFMKFRAE